jgi:hypothetical protein
MRHHNDGSDIGSTAARGWAELRRSKRLESMTRVLAYIFRFEGEAHTEARAKELTAEDWTLESEIRGEAPGILHKLTQGGPAMLKRYPGVVFKDEHGITMDYLGKWLWLNADADGKLK